MYERMIDDMDINAGAILDGDAGRGGRPADLREDPGRRQRQEDQERAATASARRSSPRGTSGRRCESGHGRGGAVAARARAPGDRPGPGGAGMRLARLVPRASRSPTRRTWGVPSSAARTCSGGPCRGSCPGSGSSSRSSARRWRTSATSRTCRSALPIVLAAGLIAGAALALGDLMLRGLKLRRLLGPWSASPWRSAWGPPGWAW